MPCCIVRPVLRQTGPTYAQAQRALRYLQGIHKSWRLQMRYDSELAEIIYYSSSASPNQLLAHLQAQFPGMEVQVFF